MTNRSIRPSSSIFSYYSFPTTLRSHAAPLPSLDDRREAKSVVRGAAITVPVNPSLQQLSPSTGLRHRASI